VRSNHLQVQKVVWKTWIRKDTPFNLCRTAPGSCDLRQHCHYRFFRASCTARSSHALHILLPPEVVSYVLPYAHFPLYLRCSRKKGLLFAQTSEPPSPCHSSSHPTSRQLSILCTSSPCSILMHESILSMHEHNAVVDGQWYKSVDFYQRPHWR
jgi:hypothetical protein